jgi:phosphoadenosine phosphosulfate reductase
MLRGGPPFAGNAGRHSTTSRRKRSMRDREHNLGQVAAELGYDGGEDAESVLAWAIDRFTPNIALACSFQTVVLVHMVHRIKPDITVFAIDTGRLNEETYECARDVEQTLGIRIRWWFPKHEAVEKLVHEKGLFSFRENVDNRRECCYVRKVEPLNRALSGLDAWISGLRREQSAARGDVRKIEIDRAHGNIVKINPIADWTSTQVRDYVKRYRLPYNRLMDRGYKSIGCAPCTRPVEQGEHPRAGRWWWEHDDHRECGIHVRNWNI